MAIHMKRSDSRILTTHTGSLPRPSDLVEALNAKELGRNYDAHALAAPFGRLHFAGEYIDTDFTGLMEGALRSGERAAEAIVESLRIAA